MPYAGRVAFDIHCQSMIARLPAKDRKNYIITPNRRRAWEVAVSSAEHAWMLSREQRIDEFIPPMSSYGRSVLPSPDADRYSLELSRGSDVIPDHESSATVLSRTNDGVVEAESREHFASFCLHNRKSLCLMHPGFTADQIDCLLAMQWNELDSAAKLQYAG